MNRLYRALVLAGLPVFGGVKEAVSYLEAEVPRWKAENGCYSCHNNGDGARALLAAGVRGPAVEDTIRFLGDRSRWDARTLSKVQYASALALIGDVQEAAALVAKAQSADGHWRVDEELAPGSPVTYGPVLGTAMALNVLKKAGGFEDAVEKAEIWLRARKADHPLDVAALVMALHRTDDGERLRKMQSADGSWNGEAFDTAVAVIALEGNRRGRDWLLKHQLEPGGWAGTTRPPGGGSYAQHISTSAWALLALLVR